MRIGPSNWGSGSDLGAVQAIVLPVGAFLLVWFVNMAITGIVASRQRRDDGAWALIALAIGPVALLLLLVVPRTSLRRATPDPTLATAPTAPEWPAHVEGWVALTYPPPPITIERRLLAALIGAALGGTGAALLLLIGGQPILGIQIIVWAASGAVVGYLLSSELIGAAGRKLAGIGFAAAALVIVVAELLVGVLSAIPDLSMGAVGIFTIMLAVLSSIILPILYALYAQGLLAVAVAGGLIWAAVTSQVLRRGSAQAV